MKRSHTVRLIATCAFLGTVLLCCGLLALSPVRSLKRKVERKEVIGKWILTGASLRLAIRGGYMPGDGEEHSLVLDPDGTCVISFIYCSFWDEELDYHGACRGRWKLHHNTNANTNVRRRNALELEVGMKETKRGRRRNFNLYIWLDFAEEDGVLRLWDFWGDSDNYEFMEYEKDVAALLRKHGAKE